MYAVFNTIQVTINIATSKDELEWKRLTEKKQKSALNT